MFYITRTMEGDATFLVSVSITVINLIRIQFCRGDYAVLFQTFKLISTGVD